MLSCSHSTNHNLRVETTFITRAGRVVAKRGLQNIWECSKETGFECWSMKLLMQLSVLPTAEFMTQIVFPFIRIIYHKKKDICFFIFFLEKELFKQKKY